MSSVVNKNFPSSNTKTVIKENLKNKEKWKNKNINTYDLEISIWIFGPASGEYVVEVKNNKAEIIEGKLKDYNGKLVGSINDLFSLVDSCVNEGGETIEVKYDEQLGYPKHIYCDHNKYWSDDEYKVNVNKLSIQSNKANQL